MYIAVMFTGTQSLGTVPVSIDCWNIKVRNGGIAGAASFSIRAGMRSGPVALDGLILSDHYGR